jgi:hypothetical protein
MFRAESEISRMLDIGRGHEHKVSTPMNHLAWILLGIGKETHSISCIIHAYPELENSWLTTPLETHPGQRNCTTPTSNGKRLFLVHSIVLMLSVQWRPCGCVAPPICFQLLAHFRLRPT